MWGMFLRGCEDTVAPSHLLCKVGGGGYIPAFVRFCEGLRCTWMVRLAELVYQFIQKPSTPNNKHPKAGKKYQEASNIPLEMTAWIQKPFDSFLQRFNRFLSFLFFFYN